MARKKGAKRRRYLAAVLNGELSTGTLAAKSLSSTDFPDTVVESAWCTSIDAIWSMLGWTVGTAEGPLMVGIAHSDYANSEIEEFIENVNSWNEGDLVSQEISKRKIRIVGTFTTPNGPSEGVVLNDGKTIHTKVNWMIPSGMTMAVWAYNLGDNSLTTAAQVDARGRAHLWPQ